MSGPELGRGPGAEGSEGPGGSAVDFTFNAAPSTCFPAGSLRTLPFASRTRNGAFDAITSDFFPAASRTRTFVTGARSIDVPR